MRLLTPYELWFRCTNPSMRPLFGIPTHLTHREKIALYRMIGNDLWMDKRPISIVEIGSYLGASSMWLAAGLRDNGLTGTVYCIDTWNNDAMSEGTRDTMSEFLTNTQPLSAYIVPLQGLSTNADILDRLQRAAGSIDLLFIDGDHSHEGVVSDWEAYSPLLSNQSVVAMHDIGWAVGVQRVVADRIRPLAVKEWRLPNLWWGRVQR
jgi:predicted O-methyltransferase YrrM